MDYEVMDNENDNIASDNKSKEIGDQLAILIGVVLLGAGTFLGIKMLKKLIIALNEHIDWDIIAQKIITTIETQTSEGDLIPRLDRAEELLKTGEKFNIDMAALMVGATLEKSLKIMSNSSGTNYNGLDRPKGVVDIAVLLREQRIIELNEFEMIKKISREIRNPAAHGEFQDYGATQVYSALRFVRGFITKHMSIISKSSPSVDCFIATATYGSPFNSNVITLKTFRDCFLKKTIIGRKIIKAYNKSSPLLASPISRFGFFKKNYSYRFMACGNWLEIDNFKD